MATKTTTSKSVTPGRKKAVAKMLPDRKLTRAKAAVAAKARPAAKVPPKAAVPKSVAAPKAAAAKTQAPKAVAAPKATPRFRAKPVKFMRKDLDINYFRNLLLSERERLESDREQLRATSLDVEGALPEEGEMGEEDTADLASAMMDKEMELSVEEEIDDLLVAVDRALQKIEDGTYGICDICGEPIPASRLELIPWAALTVGCQALSEGH